MRGTNCATAGLKEVSLGCFFLEKLKFSRLLFKFQFTAADQFTNIYTKSKQKLGLLAAFL